MSLGNMIGNALLNFSFGELEMERATCSCSLHDATLPVSLCRSLLLVHSNVSYFYAGDSQWLSQSMHWLWKPLHLHLLLSADFRACNGDLQKGGERER